MWTNLKNKRFKDLSPGRLSRAIARRVRNIPHRISWEIPTRAQQENKRKLLRFKDLHAGERCVVVANGPSLQKIDFTLLQGIKTIGMNRIHLMKAVNGFMPDYLVVADIETKLAQFTDEFNTLEIPRFFHWNARHLFDESPNLCFFKDSFSAQFQPDFTKLIGTGKSVTYVCIQLAFFMGFTEVVLIGKDHDYKASGLPHSLVTSTGEEVNHFIAGYHEPGMKWRIPDYYGEEYSYSLAKKAFEESGRRIVDATIGGNLKVFEKVDFHSYFASTTKGKAQ